MSRKLRVKDYRFGLSWQKTKIQQTIHIQIKSSLAFIWHTHTHTKHGRTLKCILKDRLLDCDDCKNSLSNWMMFD